MKNSHPSPSQKPFTSEPAASYRLALELLSHSLDGVSALGQQGLIQMLFGLLIRRLHNRKTSYDPQWHMGFIFNSNI